MSDRSRDPNMAFEGPDYDYEHASRAGTVENFMILGLFAHLEASLQRKFMGTSVDS